MLYLGRVTLLKLGLAPEVEQGVRVRNARPHPLFHLRILEDDTVPQGWMGGKEAQPQQNCIKKLFYLYFFKLATTLR